MFTLTAFICLLFMYLLLLKSNSVEEVRWIPPRISSRLTCLFVCSRSNNAGTPSRGSW